MNYKQHFKSELDNPATQYFIFDSKGSGQHGDIDFFQYQWSPSRYNLVNEGDVFICRRPGKASETGKFYFFGAAKINRITGTDRLTGSLVKPYPFQEYIHQNDLDNFIWTWKQRGDNWEHFFNQYGMNKINKIDFENLLQYSDDFGLEDTYEPDAATEATQEMQKGNYSAEDREGKSKLRSKQQVFSNKVKANYGSKCAFCSLTTKHFLVGSHIIPWSKKKETRLDPSNGLCLCSFHDKAFDKGFLTINDNYKIIVTKRVIHDSVLNALLIILNNNSIILPKQSRPNKEYLRYHRENIFDKF